MVSLCCSRIDPRELEITSGNIAWYDALASRPEDSAFRARMRSFAGT